LGERMYLGCSSLEELDSAFISKWQALENRALEANAFLSPSFILPAARHLNTGTRPFCLHVHRGSSRSGELVGLGVFERRLGSKMFPLPHVAAYTASKEAFLTGFQVDPEYAEEVVQKLFRHLAGLTNSHGIVFDQRSLDTEQARLLDHVADQSGHSWIGTSYERPCLDRTAVTNLYPNDFLSKGSLKKRRRGWRELEADGNTSFVTIDCADEMARHDAIDEFLRLEGLGWKSEEGTAMVCDKDLVAFFRDTCTRFASSDRLLITQIRTGDTIISSTCNFFSGGTGFAYKLGWDPDYRRARPGFLQEVELAILFRDRMTHLTDFDSCTAEDTFLQLLWPGTRTVSFGTFPTTRLGLITATARRDLRKLKKQALQFASNFKR